MKQTDREQKLGSHDRRGIIVSAPRDNRPVTLSELLARTAERAGQHEAVCDGDLRLNWTMVESRAEHLAADLGRAGATPGDRIAIWLPNGADYLVAIFAIARLGATIVHLNTRFGPVEVSDILARSAAKLLVTRTSFGAIDLMSTLHALDFAALPALEAICFFGGLPASPLPIVSTALEPSGAGRIADRAAPEAPAFIYTSSGTTARPKLIVHDQASIVGHADDVAARIGMGDPGAKLLATVPFCGTFGNIAAMAAVAGGASLICLDVFDPDQAASLIRDARITHLFGDDRMVGRLAEAARGVPFDSVRFSAIAAFHPESVASIARGIAVGLHPHSIYGSSEMQALYALAPQVSGEQVAVAPVSANAAFDIVDGELLLRGRSSFASYLDDPDRTAAARNCEGYFRSGDHAERAGRGFVFRSRIDDVLRLGGFLVNPREIEEFVQGLPGVAGAQVVGIDQGGRSLPFAFVIGEQGAEIREEDLLAACRAALARYKVPVRALIVDNFPTTVGANGVKIQRGRLREIAQDNLAPKRAANDAGAIAGNMKAEIA